MLNIYDRVKYLDWEADEEYVEEAEKKLENIFIMRRWSRF